MKIPRTGFLFLPKTWCNFGFILIGRIVSLGLVAGVRRAKFVEFLAIISTVEKRLSVSMSFAVLLTGIQPWLINCGISIRLEMTGRKKKNQIPNSDYFSFFFCEINYLWNHSYIDWNNQSGWLIERNLWIRKRLSSFQYATSHVPFDVGKKNTIIAQ